MSLQLTSTQAADAKAIQIVQQFQNLAAQTTSLLANGSPAQGVFPAFTGTELQTVLGTNLTKIQTALTALS